MEDNPRFFDLVGQVRAMRRLKPDPVPHDLLMKVLDKDVNNVVGWMVLLPCFTAPLLFAFSLCMLMLTPSVGCDCSKPR